MAQFIVLLATTVALLGSISAHTKPNLLTVEQQQDLLDQLAQLQRQTQQLLNAQKSLSAVQTNKLQVITPKPKKPVVPKSVKKAVPLQKRAPKPTPVAKPTPAPALPKAPQINWGNCPEFAPSEAEKIAKAADINKCLDSTPLAGKVTRASVEKHREQIAACALRAEGWFTQSGDYDYDKAENEIVNKGLDSEVERELVSYHGQCKSESEQKYSSHARTQSSIIAQIQLYQACMDYWIADVCKIVAN